MAQQHDPRGIYRLTKMTIKNGTTVKAPVDQYKFCGDSACVMLMYQKKVSKGSDIELFMLTNSDLKPFNYTGDKSNEEIGVWIYDSYDTHFTLKWYSTVANHPYFPLGGWVTEWYDTTVGISDFAKRVINAFKPHDAKTQMDGIWEVVGSDPKVYMLINDSDIIMFNAYDCDYQRQRMYITGGLMDFSYNGERYIKIGNADQIVEWEGKDMVRLTPKNNITNGGQIWQRTEMMPAYKAFFETFDYN